MLYRLRKYLPQFLEMFIFIIIIAISILLYTLVSELVGILTIGGMLLIMLFYYLVSSPGSINRLKYNPLMKILLKFQIAREEEIIKNIDWSEQKLHKAMYSLSKTWQYGPMVIYIKPYYLFLNENLIVTILKKMIPISQQTTPNFQPLIKSLVATIPFNSRQEVEKVITKLRELPEFKKNL
ncbi:hypothetical protein NEF87_001583 [Candidatus Lokiarchaeum ossiferum]|uniref:Uncharacterized protein n=1 Tax=Candidatus Lokiarchaeum ossiferum TaxID=2951803 RepID=A0ABY6HP49_9ARCH|nr:hypothetical protein NEF87_001583 [Candidatus Lokiarchaeum sp. B-35]